MAFEALTEAAVPVHYLVVRHHPDRFVYRIQQRRSVPLGEDQVVVVGVAGIIPVVAKMPGDEHGHEVGGRHAGRGMP
jgi:hypothetical protein